MAIDGTIIYANKSSSEMLGYSLDRLGKIKMSDFLDKEDLNLPFNEIDKMIKTKMPSQNKRYSLKTADGHFITGEAIAIPIEDKDKTLTILGVARDSTERVEVEKSLIESQQQYKSLFENSPISLWVEDFSEVKKYIENIRSSGVKNFRKYFKNNKNYVEKCAAMVKVVDINRATLELYKAESKEVFFEGLGLILDENEGSYNTFKEKLIAISEGKTSFESEAANKSLTGEKIYITQKWTVVPGSEEEFSKVLVSIVDITNRKRSEKTLKESEEKYRNLFESSRDVVYLSTAEGKFLDINQSGEEFLGYSRDELLEIDILNIYNNPNDRSKFKNIIEKKGFVKDYEIVFKKEDGTLVECLTTANLRKDKSGSIVVYQGIIRDISEKKRMVEQLHSTEKMETLGTLTGCIAHDFNNILATVLGYASFLKGKAKKGDLFYEGLYSIEKSAIRASDLTSQLLAYTRRGKLEVRPINLNRLVKEVYDLIIKTFDKSIKIILETEGNLRTVEGDKSQLSQVVINIAVNAQNAMPRGGIFKIKTYIEKVKEEIEWEYFILEPGNYVCMKFTDTGIGMNEETLNRIFEPYFTTRGDKGGTGLGMSVVFGIVKGHDGYINIESKLDEGTEIAIYLPTSIKEEMILDSEVGESLGGTETVLIIDDEKSIIKMTKKLLEESGYNVHTAGSGKTGLKTFRDKYIDIVILDIKMPEMDGEEIIEKLLKIDSNAKVLLSSGYSEEDQHLSLLRMGAKGFIGKPFVVEKLLR